MNPFAVANYVYADKTLSSPGMRNYSGTKSSPRDTQGVYPIFHVLIWKVFIGT